MPSQDKYSLLALLSAVQQGQQLEEALLSLDPVSRQLVSLDFWRDLSHEEIAGITSLPLGTVKSHIRLVLVTLRQLLSTDVIERT